jgi:hypothetical protein
MWELHLPTTTPTQPLLLLWSTPHSGGLRMLATGEGYKVAGPIPFEILAWSSVVSRLAKELGREVIPVRSFKPGQQMVGEQGGKLAHPPELLLQSIQRRPNGRLAPRIGASSRP